MKLTSLHDNAFIILEIKEEIKTTFNLLDETTKSCEKSTTKKMLPTKWLLYFFNTSQKFVNLNFFGRVFFNKTNFSIEMTVTWQGGPASSTEL